MLYKYCSCGLKIEYSQGKCPDCKAKAEELYKARRKRYRDNKPKDKEMAFYNTSQWTKLRNYIVNSYLNMSVYSYCKEGRIVDAEIVHHIKPIRDSWDDRLNKYNLIPLTAQEHLDIHNRMEVEGKEVVMQELNEMLEQFRKEFDIEL